MAPRLAALARSRPRDDQGRVYLKGWTEIDRFSVVLCEADEPGMDSLGFKVFG